MAMELERYREIIPEWEEFRAACARPEPTVIRTRTGRIEPDALRGRLEDRGFVLSSIPSLPHFFRIREEPHRISDTPEHWLGLLYVQQASTGVAAAALDPRPGERLLDLCAAPGGKTTHLADLTNDRATIVASDADDKRLRGLLGNLYRMSHASVMVVNADGRRFPEGATFDRVLVDAPCSAEGTVRRHGGEIREQPASFLEYVSRLQEALLRRAVRLTRPGGSVLYVTCTFNPHENEAVVARVLEDAPVSVAPVEDAVAGGEAVPHAPGLTEWEGRSFPPDLEAAWRIYPHHLDSGGLFLCRLRKKGATEEGERMDESRGPAAEAAGTNSGEPEPGPGVASGWRRIPAAYPADDGVTEEHAEERVTATVETLTETFGVPRARLERTGWMARGDSVWGHTQREWPLESWEETGGWRFVALGIRALREDRRFGLRVTNDGLRWLGPALERRVVDLEPGRLSRLLEGDRLPVDPSLGDGNVALRLDTDVVGRGVVWKGELRHEIPKSKARRLRSILEVSHPEIGDGSEPTGGSPV